MKSRRGIILAGGSGTRLYPLTIATSKQLMPVYDKPMVYYPLSVLMLAGIREVLVISTPGDLPHFRKLLGSGEYLGMRFEYAEQPSPDGLAQAFLIGKEFLDGHPACLILGDNMFYGAELPERLLQASARESGATIFGYHVANPAEYGVVEFAQDGRVVSLEEKPKHPKSHYAVPGIYYFDDTVCEEASLLKPSARGELEITDLNRRYLERGALHVEVLGRGVAWLDTGTHDSLLEAANFVHAIQKRQGLKIAAIEEIAFEQGWINREQLANRAAALGKTEYATYLKTLAADGL